MSQVESNFIQFGITRPALATHMVGGEYVYIIESAFKDHAEMEYEMWLTAFYGDAEEQAYMEQSNEFCGCGGYYCEECASVGYLLDLYDELDELVDEAWSAQREGVTFVSVLTGYDDKVKFVPEFMIYRGQDDFSSWDVNDVPF